MTKITKRHLQLVVNNVEKEPLDECDHCINPAEEEHTCPYREDLYADSVTLCNCCATCRQNCCDDI